MTILQVKHLTGLTERSIGLMRYKKPTPVLIHTRFGIHTFGLTFQIDVLVLDNNNIVVKYAENLPPGRIFVWWPLHKKVIELPAGGLKKSGIKKGDKIKLIRT